MKIDIAYGTDAVVEKRLHGRQNGHSLHVPFSAFHRNDSLILGGSTIINNVFTGEQRDRKALKLFPLYRYGNKDRSPV